MMQVDFAIITTRSDEFRAIFQRFPARVYTVASGRTYGISQIQTTSGKDCTVAIVRNGEQGTDATQQIASDMIRDLDPQVLLVVGIAGGVPSDDFTLGDVIVSSRIDNFNMSKRYEGGVEKFDIRGGIHPSISNIAASLPLYKTELTGWNTPESITLDRPKVDLKNVKLEIQEKLADRQKNASWYEQILNSITVHFGNEKNRARSPLFKTGTIASSNSLIRNIDVLVQWLQDTHSILAVEMEVAGVYQATQQISQRYPVIAIRGISDITGLDRDNQWTKYACQTAAAFTYAFVRAEIISPRATATSTPASASPPVAQQTAQSSQTQKPIEVFISYSEEDEKFKKQLETHLSLLKREKLINPWHSQQTKVGGSPGSHEQEIAEHIDAAQIVLLLMSPSFIASDQLYKNEMTRAIERQKAGDPVRVIPIAVHHIASGDPDKTPDFQKIQGLPRSGKPIEAWRNPDEAWALIAQEVREVCKDLRAKIGKREATP